MVRDIKHLLLGDDEAEEELAVDEVLLWDEKGRSVESGVSYGGGTEDADDGDDLEGNGVILED
jgi:hypothetical protein